MKISIAPLTPPWSQNNEPDATGELYQTEESHPTPAPEIAVAASVKVEATARIYEEGEKARRTGYWRRIGGGSLLISLMVHAGILLLAYFMVQTITQPEKKVDFLPGGGSKAGDAASQALAHHVRQKKSHALHQKSPMKKVVSTSVNSAIALPEMSMDTIEMPESASLTQAMAGGSGSSGMGSQGAGGGFGSGIGMGGAKGFGPTTFFGRTGEGGGLAGSFYDLKQDPERKPTGYSKGSFAEVIQKAAAANFSDSVMKGYYKARQQMNFTYLLVPSNMAASEGPKCFNVANEVEPSGWFVHYGGTVVPPRAGMWRFVGFFDDLLIVYVNNKPVLDGSWVPMAAEYAQDKEIRQDFHGPAVAGGRTAYCGKWIKLSEPFRLDIVVGERPGGKVGGLLLVQDKEQKYKTREDGTPVLPLFTAARPEISDLSRMRRDDYARSIQLDTDPPVFEPRISLGGGTRTRGLGLLPPR